MPALCSLLRPPPADARCRAPPQVSAIAVTGGGPLSLARLALPYSDFGMALAGLSGAGSRLVLESVTVPEHPEWGALTGTVTARAEGEPPVFDPPDLQMPPGFFVVNSGPCTLAEGGRCVGRPGGYGNRENCAITVAGSGVLGPCPVFNTEGCPFGDRDNCPDRVTMPVEAMYGGTAERWNGHGGTDCPVGAMLFAGQTLSWRSDSSNGGRWQICFA